MAQVSKRTQIRRLRAIIESRQRILRLPHLDKEDIRDFHKEITEIEAKIRALRSQKMKSEKSEAMSARDMRYWFETQLITLADKMSRTATSTRVNTLAKGLDAWCKLYRLENDTATIEELAARLEDLEKRLKGGPQGIVNGGQG